MSRKTEASTPKIDRRVRRTRDALGDALLTLMQEKAFETITVQQVLDRAGIGRSTFYAHYRDKNDLFLSDLEDFFEPMSTLLLRHREASNRMASVRELFPHVAEMRHLHAALIPADKVRAIFWRWNRNISRTPSSSVSASCFRRTRSPQRNAPPRRTLSLERCCHSCHVGSIMVRPTPPEEMDKLHSKGRDFVGTVLWGQVGSCLNLCSPAPEHLQTPPPG